MPLAWCPHHQRELRWLLVGTPTTASPSGFAAGLVSSPPAGFAVVVGGDTNNGFAELR